MTIALSAAVLVLVVIIGFMFVKLRIMKSKIRRPLVNLDVTSLKYDGDNSGNVAESKTALAERIVVGEHADQPVISIEVSQNLVAYNQAKPIGLQGGQLSKLSSLLQAAPSLMVATESAGKQLMEVVIDGKLARAADGNGLRAFALGEKGIKENARLFEVQNLQNMINAAALWQVASVLVAQKHLADINQKLEKISAGIQGISQFLDNQRKARIHSSYLYLQQVHTAIANGELSSSVRNELESIERELLEIQKHLEKEFLYEVEQDVKGSDTFGTEDLTHNLVSKACKLNELTHDMTLCLQTRIAAWHVFSLYPGEPQLKKSRKEMLERCVTELRELAPHIGVNLVFQSQSIKSFWNRQATLDERRTKVQAKADAATDRLIDQVNTNHQALVRTSELLVEHDRPIHVLLNVENGRILEARQAF